MRGRAGVATTPMAMPRSLDDLLELVGVPDVEPRDLFAQPAGVGVDKGGDAEATRREPAVVGQRVAEVADADDDDRPVGGEADLAGDLVAQEVDLVADPAGAVGAQVGEVFAQLGGVDPGRRGQLFGRDRGDAPLGQIGERPQVERQPRDRRLRHAALRCCGWCRRGRRTAVSGHDTPRSAGAEGDIRGPGDGPEPARLTMRSSLDACERVHKVAVLGWMFYKAPVRARRSRSASTRQKSC